MLLSRSAFAAPSKVRPPSVPAEERDPGYTRAGRPISRGYSQFGEISRGSIPDFIGHPSNFNRVPSRSIEVPNDNSRMRAKNATKQEGKWMDKLGPFDCVPQS